MINDMDGMGMQALKDWIRCKCIWAAPWSHSHGQEHEQEIQTDRISEHLNESRA